MPESFTTPDDEMEKLRQEYSNPPKPQNSGETTPDDVMAQLRSEYGIGDDESKKYYEKYKEEANPITSGISGLSSGLSLGMSPKIISYLQSKFGGGNVEDIYKDVKGRQMVMEAANPKTFGAGKLIGNIVTGSKFPSLRGAAITGGIAGYGESPELNPLDAKTDIAKGAALGFGAQKGIESIGKLPFLQKWLREKAGGSAVKAVTGGGQLNVIRDASRRSGGIERTGGHLLEVDKNLPNDLRKKTLGWGVRGDSVADEIYNKKEFYGNAIGDIGIIVDEINPSIVDATKIADKIEQTVAQNLAGVPTNDPIRNKLLKDAEYLRSIKRISFTDAQKLKNNYDFKAKGAIPEFDDAVKNALHNAVSSEMDFAVEDAYKQAVKRGMSGDYLEILKEYNPIKQRYQSYRMLSKAAKEFGEKELSRRFASPSDQAFFWGGLGAGGLMSDLGLAGTVATGVGASMANKVVRERGRSVVANTLNTIANLMDSSPEFMKKYGTLLTQVVQEKGIPLIVAHGMAMKNNPDYARYFKEQK